MLYYVYAIKNIVNNKMYVGITKNLRSRWYHHKYDLKNNHHANSKLQNAYNKYGKDKFVYYIIETNDCDFNYIANREIYYIKLYDSCDNGYNLTYGGDGTDYKKISESTRQKMRKFMLGNKYALGKKQSKETRIKKSISMKNCVDMEDRKKRASNVLKELWKQPWFREKMLNLNYNNKYNLGKHLSDITKKKLSDNQIGCKNSFYGKKHSDETKKLLSDIAKARWCDDEYVNKVAIARDKVMKSDEYREKQRKLSTGRSIKTTELDAINIRYRYLCGDKPADIHKIYTKLSLSGLKKICYNNSWKHLPNTKEDLYNMLINYQHK